MPEPGPGEVHVCVHAAGLNPIDWKLAPGGHEARHYSQFPHVDGAGTIEGLETGLEHLKIGDRVSFFADMTRPASFADFVTLSAETVARIPDRLTFEAAAAMPCAGMTACYSLHDRPRVARARPSSSGALAGQLLG